jgi:glyoxylase I family protein
VSHGLADGKNAQFSRSALRRDALSLGEKETDMKIKLNSIMVSDQAKALDFYTRVLGFVKSKDIPVGEFRWLTVTAPEGHPDVELALEPNVNPAAKTFQEEMFKQGIPLTAFESTDIEADYQRLKKGGVMFTMKQQASGPVTLAIFADTCGNLIQLYQPTRT